MSNEEIRMILQVGLSAITDFVNAYPDDLDSKKVAEAIAKIKQKAASIYPEAFPNGF